MKNRFKEIFVFSFDLLLALLVTLKISIWKQF